MRTFLQVLVCIALGWIGSAASAATVIYPVLHPEVKQLPAVPPWLPKGSGDDGYVSVTAKISAADVCTNLGNAGFLGTLFRENVQIVVTLRSAGFGSAFEGVEIPIATFDARGKADECWGLSKLPATVIPHARLPKFSASVPGSLGLMLQVHSSTDVKSNIIPTALAITEVAAVFASGPAAGAVAATSTTLAKPILSSLEKGLDGTLKATVRGASPYFVDWAGIRKGVGSLSFPVYSGSSNWGESTDDAIKRLQSQSGQDAQKKLFDIVLEFSYAKTIFDLSVSGESELPGAAAIQSGRILNQPNFAPNFLQLLNASSPSVQQAVASIKTPSAWKAICGRLNGSLEGVGLNRLDRIIVTKAFIDEAKATAEAPWYVAANIRECFVEDDLKLVQNMYGSGGQALRIRGVQDGLTPEHREWMRTVLPVANDLASALKMERNREQILAAINGRKDFSNLVDLGWAPAQAPAESDASGSGIFKQYPQIWLLASRRAASTGCFAYFDPENLKKDPSAFHMVVSDEQKKLWRVLGRVDLKGSPRVVSVEVRPLDEAWSDSWASYFTDDESCKKLLQLDKAT